jgi:hypothetical protein
MNLEEMQRMYLRADGKGGRVLWTVPDQTPAPAKTTAPPPLAPVPSHEIRRQR